MPRAAGLAEEIQHQFTGFEIDYIKGSEGVFDVYLNENLIFSKFNESRFPVAGEIIERINQQISG